MSNLWPRVEPLLARVEKPARYIGMERGSLRPEHRPSSTSWLLVYPDTYEIGLPNQGLQILYEILNERSDAAAERSYAPWVDLEAELRANNLPLFRVDTDEEAVRLANDTEFGLAAYVYTRDLARSWRVTEALEYGIVGLNTGLISTEVAPFGGVKESGSGREGSKYGILEFTELKYICVGGI